MSDTTAVFILLISFIYGQDFVIGLLVYNQTGMEFNLTCPEGYFNLAVMNSKDQDTLVKLMNERNVNRDVWLPVVRVKYLWLDNFEVDKSFYESPWSSDQTCGLLHLRDEVPEVDVCQLRQMGYICGPREKDCSDVRRPEQCIGVNGTFFIYKCVGSISWEDARRACDRHKLDLGVVRGLFKILSKRIYGSNGHCKKAWIGMRKDEKWVQKNPERTEPLVNATYTNWDKREPSSSGDCAVASFQGGLWKTVNCTQTAAYVCMPLKAAHTTSTPTEDLQKLASTPADVTERKTPPNTTAETSGEGASVAMRVGISVAIVIVIVIIITTIICFCRKKQSTKKRRKMVQEKKLEKSEEEIEQLKEKNEDKWEKYKQEEIKQWKLEIEKRKEAQEILAGPEEEEMVPLPAPGCQDCR